MKKVFLLSIICIIFGVTASAQNCIHTWKMGPLTWNDFTHKNAVNGQYAYLEYYMSIEHTSTAKDGITYRKPSVKAYTLPEHCWCDTLYRTPTMLQCNQCCFDLIEVYRRHLEKELTDDLYGDGAQLLNNTMRSLADDMTRIQDETNWGTDTVALRKYQAEIKQMLDATNYATVPNYKDALCRWGFTFDLNLLGTFGQLHDYFSWGGGASWYGEVGIGRNFLGMGMYINGAKCRQDADNIKPESNDYLLKNDPLAQLDMFAYYGFSVIDNAHHRLTPFVGYGFQGFYYTPDDESNSSGFTTGSIHFGVDYNRIWSNEIDYWGGVIDGYNASHDILNLNVKLFATYNQYRKIVGAPSGFTINLQVGIGLLTGRTKVF